MSNSAVGPFYLKTVKRGRPGVIAVTFTRPEKSDVLMNIDFNEKKFTITPAAAVEELSSIEDVCAAAVRAD